MTTRCGWCGSDPIYVDYHDNVWGRPEYNSQELFAKLCLDGQQAGLSWITILKKQQNYEKAFYNFDPRKIVRYAPRKIETLMQYKGIVRNRLKIEAIIANAQAYLDLEKQGHDFSEYIWSFVGGVPIQNRFKSMDDMPTSTPVSDRMAKSLKKHGFKFVGTTICYAFMQAVGMVNDHLVTCKAYQECFELG